MSIANRKWKTDFFSLYRLLLFLLLLLLYCGVFFSSSIKEKKKIKYHQCITSNTDTKNFLGYFRSNSIQLSMFPMNDFRSKMMYRYIFSPSSSLIITSQFWSKRWFVLVYWRRKKMWSWSWTSDIVLCPIFRTRVPEMNISVLKLNLKRANLSSL